MGTRNLTMVYYNGQMKISQYGQWDGYLTGNGSTILDFLKTHDISMFKERVSQLKEYTKEELEEIEKNHPNDWHKKFPWLSRDMGANILSSVYNGNTDKVAVNKTFIYDSLFCEYAYIIDLDKDEWEIYQGFQKNQIPTTDRFYKEVVTTEYYPCRLIKSYKLTDLPENIEIVEDDFNKICEIQKREILSQIPSLTDVQREKLLQILFYIKVKKQPSFKYIDILNNSDKELISKEYQEKSDCLIDFELPEEIKCLDDVSSYEIPKIIKFVRENF